VFSSCTSLTNISINAANPNYTSEGGALYNKTKTTLLAYPAASGNITIPASVTSINRQAFWGSNLTSITIHANVTSIGYSALTGCTNLTSITVNASNPNYTSESGILYNKEKTTLIHAPGAIRGNLTIPASVTSIGGYAFYKCAGLTAVTIPARVTTIDSSAFSGCTGLTSVNIPAGVTTIGSSAFSGCTSLAAITIPASVASVDYGPFSQWTSSQTINVQGKANQAAADSAWGGVNWRAYCEARINYTR